MKNFYDSVRSERQLKSLTGLGKSKFEELLQAFEQTLVEIRSEKYRRNRKKRSRRPGGGRKGKLSTPENKLFFILFYLKEYPTYDVLGFTFDLNPSKAEENVKTLLPVLKRTQSKLNTLPKRILQTSSQLEEAVEEAVEEAGEEAVEEAGEAITPHSPLPDTTKNGQKAKYTSTSSKMVKTEKTIFIDVTERDHFRHQDNSKQKKHYSGKRKRHTVKNTIVSDSKRRILFLGRTKPGSLHDYKMFKKEFSKKVDWFSKVNVYVDLGYQGIKKDYSSAQNIKIPHKKPRKSKKKPNPSLTRKQKAENQQIASKRVVVEHAIGGMKAFHILTNKFRNRTKNLVDEVIFQVSGLWNLKISS